jgi:methionine synthase I (cobalamin-dependent)
MFGKEAQGATPVSVAAETSRRRKVRAEDLPPIDELESAPEEVLMEFLGFPEQAAKDFVKLDVERKRKIIAESKVLINMKYEDRADALGKIRKAWPTGPMPQFSGEAEPAELLPPGTCFPLSRYLRDGNGVAPGAPDWGLESSAGKSAGKPFFKRKDVKPPATQKEALKSLKCDVTCTGSTVSPDADVVKQDLCKLEGSVDQEQISATIMAKGVLKPDDVAKYINKEMKTRVFVLDGSMGKRLESEKLEEADYRGDRFKSFKDADLKGNIDMLNLTKSNLITDIHKEYLQAGADIIRTNSLGSTSFGQATYKMQKIVYELNKGAAQLAKKAAGDVTKQDPKKPRFVAGVLGPISGATWDDLTEAYDEQLRGLMDGGIDMLMLEAVADTLSAKAAIYATDEYFAKNKKKRLPVIISASIGEGGKTASGASVEAFFVSVKYAKPLMVGVTSTLGVGEVKKFYKSLSDLSTCWCGLSASGSDPEKFASEMADLAKEKLVNFVAGETGTLPASISAVAKKLSGGSVRPPLSPTPSLQLSGLDALLAAQGVKVIGQRCASMGSAKFKKLINAYKATHSDVHLKAAVEVAAKQAEKGADILDINLDSDVTDFTSPPWKGEMSKFISVALANPSVAKLPLMICSSNWKIIEEGLQSAPGKCIVNSLCLMVGEDEFVRIAKECKSYGAALVVMATSETGSAESYEDKVRVCQRSYRLLRSKVDFPAEDIIFDCQVSLLGYPETAGSAASFIKAVEEIKRTCPSVSLIAGVGNLSAPFRGLNKLRDAMHSVFLYHAVPKGLNLAIADVGNLPAYGDIDPETRTKCEDLILNKGGDPLSKFTDFVEGHAGSALKASLDEPSAGAADISGLQIYVPETSELALADPADPVKHSGFVKQPLQNLVQATGTIGASIFQTFGSKAHASHNFHRLQYGMANKRSIMFSSISVWMGQGGSGPVTGASSLMDGLSLAERQQGLNNMSATVLWGAIGEIGLRLAIYGSRDVFAQFDLGQKLIGPLDTQFLERQIMTCNDVLEFIGMAYLDQTWQNTLAGIGTGGGLEGRKTFADM